MRNLVQHPITTEEILDCLKEFLSEVDPEKTRLCGDVRPLLLREAIKIVELYEDLRYQR